MKYQIYLNKTTSEMLNEIARQLDKKPSTLIKEFIENSFTMAEKTIGEEKGDLSNGTAKD